MIGHLFNKLADKLLKILYRYNISRRLIWFFIYAFVLPILLIGLFNAVYSFNKNENDAMEYLEASSTLISNNISSYLFYHMNLLDEISMNPEIVEDIEVYEQVNWDRKGQIENHIRLVIGNTLGASNAIDTCELVTMAHSFFYYPSPVTNGNFTSSQLLSTTARQVKMTIGTKEVPIDRNKYVVLTKGIYSSDNECIANIVVALDLSYINKACYKNSKDTLNGVMIVDEKGIVVGASEAEMIGFEYSEDESKYIYVSKEIENTNLMIVNRMAKTYLLKSAIFQLVITILTTMAFAFLAFVSAVIFTKSIIQPINGLIKEMNSPSIEKYVEDEGEDEYHSVIEGFNKMSGHIVEAIQGQYQLELQETKLRELRKEAELSALQQQINPHFLYNTLESIYWSGQLEGDEEISEIVSALGNYLRVIIDKGREYVSIENEVESVENYIFLQNTRFGGRIKNVWEIPPDIRKTRITKLAIHPVVENVIMVNLDEIESLVHIDIRISKKEQNIMVEMSGFGVEYFLEKAKESDIDLSGINSVDERLRLYHGEAYGVSMNLQSSVIVIKVPIYEEQVMENEIYG